MSLSEFMELPIVDCHVHLWMLRNSINKISLNEQEKSLLDIIKDSKLASMYIFSKKCHSALYIKARHEGKFYAGGYAPWTGETTKFKVDWVSYVQSLFDLGYDGIGEMGSKPVTRDVHVPLDSTYYEGFWDICEQKSFPVLCHIGDVEDFWHEELTPDWAKTRGWGYWRGEYPSLKELHCEIENVLSSHPKLKITLCHLLFMSPDLEKLEGFLESYHNAHIDISLGVELMYNISRRRDDWRSFIIKHDDRFLMGTDIGMSTTLPQHLARIWMLRTFIESDREFYTPESADELLTRYEEPYIGLNLPKSSCEKIYSGNFHRLWGDRPRNVHIDGAISSSQYQGDNALAKAFKDL